MSDSTARALDRNPETQGLVGIEWTMRRLGEPYDAPTLVRAQAITVGEAHLAFREGLWVPKRCEHYPSSRSWCNSAGYVVSPHVTVSPCPLCLCSGRQWSERQAELAAYAGEASLFDVVKERDHYDWAGIAELPADDWVGQVGEWSPLAPVAAALGVAREWVSRHHDCEPACREEQAPFQDCEKGPGTRALDAVWSYLCKPTEHGLIPARDLGYGNPVSALKQAPRNHGRYVPAVIERASLDLGEDVVAEAARAGVRRWVLRCFA